jgi:hypothetical protein
MISLVRRNFVHAFPAHGQDAVRIARGDSFDCFPECRTPGCAPCLDADVAERVQPKTVMDDRFTQKLIPKVVSEVAIVTGVNVTF